MSQPPSQPFNKPSLIAANGGNLSSGNLNNTTGGRPLPVPPSSVNSNSINNSSNVGGQPASPTPSGLKSPPPLKPRAKTVISNGQQPIVTSQNTSSSNLLAPTINNNPQPQPQPLNNANTPQKLSPPPTLPRRDWPNNNNISNSGSTSSGNLNGLVNNNNTTQPIRQSVSQDSGINKSSDQVKPVETQPPPQITPPPAQPQQQTPVQPQPISPSNSSTSLSSVNSSSSATSTPATSTPATPSSSTSTTPLSTSTSNLPMSPPQLTPPTTIPISMSQSNSNNNLLYSSSAPTSSLSGFNNKAPLSPSLTKPEPLQLPPAVSLSSGPNTPSTTEISNKQKRNSLGEQTSSTLEKMVNNENNEGNDEDGDSSKKGSKSKPKLFPHQWSMGKYTEKERKEMEKKEEKERKELEKKEEKERKEREKLEKKEKKEREKLEKKEEKEKEKDHKEKDHKEKDVKIEKPAGLSRTSSSFASKLKHATLSRNAKYDLEDDSNPNSASSVGSNSPSLTPSNRDRTSQSMSSNATPINVSSSNITISSTNNASSSNLSIHSNVSSSPSDSDSSNINIGGGGNSLSSSPPNSQSPSLSSTSHRSAIHLDTSRGLMTWGSASNCKLGFKVASKEQSQPTPERLPNFNVSDICSISSGSYYSAALTENGDVYMWGRGSVKNPPVPVLGIPQIEDQLLPIKLESLTDIVVVSIGFYHSAAVRANGELLTWGVGEEGQLGHGDTQNQVEPKVIQSLTSFWITQVQCGEKHTICLTKNGKVYTWGSSEYGQLGLGDTTRYCKPMPVTALEKYNVLQIASGSTHCAVLTNSKEVLVFGNGAAMGAASIISIPTLVPSLKYLHIDKLCCGHYSTAAISECGDVYTWGTGQELGHGNNQTESTPKLVEALRNQSIRQISCGGRHTAFLTDSGRIFTSGKDSFGQLGHQAGDQNKPKKIESLTKTTFISVSCGENYNIALFDTTRSFRDKFCWKLLETQRTYVRTLDIIQTIFLNPLRVRDRDQLPEPMKNLPYIFLSEEEIRTIFGTIEKLYALNSTVLHVINKRFANWSNKKKVGDVLLNHFKHSEDTFIQYLENLPLALTTLDNLCKKQNAPIAGYLKECEKLALERKKLDTDDDQKEFNLRSLLMEPLNVISRYHKSINGMVKYTKTTHIDYSGLVDLDSIMEIKVTKVTNMLNIVSSPTSLQQHLTSSPTVTTTAASEDSTFLKEYDIKLEALQNFKKTCTKIIKSSKKYYEVEPDSFKEQGHFSEHLINVKACFDGNIDPALASSIDQFSNSIKKIGYLRSELSTRTHTSFAQPLQTVADELENFIPLIVEMRKRVFESHTEYENAVNKLYSLAKNLQPTEKKMIEAEKEVASLKKTLDKTLFEFDAIFKEGISIQTKSLKLFYACMKAQQEYYERGLQRFQSMKPSFDALDTYFRQQSRNNWAKSIHDTVTTTFTAEKGEKPAPSASSTPSLSGVKPSQTSSVASTPSSIAAVVVQNEAATSTTPSSAPSPLVLSTSPASHSAIAGVVGDSVLSSTPKDQPFNLSNDNTEHHPAPPAQTLTVPVNKQPQTIDPYQIMTELEHSDWSFLMDPPTSNEFTDTFIEEQYNNLVEILASPSLQVVQCVVSPAQVDQQGPTIESISRIFESFGKIKPIIHAGIEQEVLSTANPSTLFRSNTTATKLMTAFTKLKGMPYLQKHITPLVREIIENPNGYEVDPAKINEGSEELMTNMMNLIQICEKFTDAIIDSVEYLPISLREISYYLQKEVVKKFPDNKYSSVGGFIFLRFLCPAILAPHTSGLVEEQPGPEATRALVLIGKVLQNLANGIEFGQKESFMIPVNRFIIGNVNRLNAYFDQLTDVSLNKSDNYVTGNSKEEVQRDIRNIHLLIVKNLSKVIKQLALYKQKDIIGQLSKTLVFLGDPSSMYK
ncbi:hypothetical protein DICPUDRAFT_79261 [Dictyostelium purpureum]|uniref:Ras-GAP domain-containing protein n=1 Tax=Dictyostelium purpureum TaxID=5786 RepID=F0ZM19_DICPU|nr:uncharacterized protein DICPUDRAFT_79261 [Dictyostelium purpureum]EGC35023.1 hypothetical protein DICPUDRAFT_79261 [Dictyostelium purpureum]|eukprot:XP_003288451.1 hypothetical protein DICPUDRAFT_79261 [Dictyostelium purpureum]